MPWFARYINCINALCTLLSLSRPVAGAGFIPRNVKVRGAIARRVCDPATPDVSESSIISEVCNQTFANDFPPCSEQMTEHMQQSTINTCGQYFGLFTDCLIANGGDHTACSDSLFGYQDCNKYTMQAYAYCGCYYTLPASLASCANEQLQPQPPDTAMAPTITAPAKAIPDTVASAAGADKEPTPAILAVSGDAAASPSSQSTTTLSDPQPSSTPTIHIASLKWAMPSSDLGTVWTPSASTELITVVVTYTTTLTTAGYTTTATLTPASISTVYTCAEGGDVTTLTAPISTSSPSALTSPMPIVLAPIDPETFAPQSAPVPAQSTQAGTAEQTRSPETFASLSAVVPARSTGKNRAEATIEQPGSLQTFASPSEATPPAQRTGVGASETTAGRNGSAVCARCRRRSKIF